MGAEIAGHLTSACCRTGFPPRSKSAANSVVRRLIEETIKVDRRIIRHGFILILISLVTGFLLPTMQIPRLGLSAHTIGILSGVLLIGIGAIWSTFSLSTRQLFVMYWSWVYSSYANWLGCLVGAFTGAGQMTPIASSGAKADAGPEAIVAVLLISVAITSLVAVALSIWGLSRPSASDA
jgi:hydroxylaminobenzene mutase